MSKKSILQKFQRGGVVLNLQPPGQILEKAVADLIDDYQYRVRLEHDEREAAKDRQLRREEMDARFVENQNARAEQIKQASLDREFQAKLVKDSDYMRIVSDQELPIDAKIRMLERMDIPHQELIAGRTERDAYQARIKTAKQGADTEALREIKSELSHVPHRYGKEYISDIDKFNQNITAKDFLESLEENQDWNMVTGGILPKATIENAAGVMALVPTVWTMFKGTRDQQINALTALIPYYREVYKDDPESAQAGISQINKALTDLHVQVPQKGGALEGGALEGGAPGGGAPGGDVKTVEEEPAEIEHDIEEGKQYLITPAKGKSFIGGSNKAKAFNKRGGSSTEVQGFEYTQMGMRGGRYYPDDSGLGKAMAVTDINEPMQIGEEGDTIVVDKDGNKYTWMGQEKDGRILNQYLKDSLGKEKKINNMIFKENYKKLIFKRPSSIPSVIWDTFKDSEKNQVLQKWDSASSEQRTAQLNQWNEELGL